MTQYRIHIKKNDFQNLVAFVCNIMSIEPDTDIIWE